MLLTTTFFKTLKMSSLLSHNMKFLVSAIFSMKELPGIYCHMTVVWGQKL